MSMQDYDLDNLILDAAPLLSTAASASNSALRGMAKNFLTTPDVVAEIRDKTSRELFATTLSVLGLETQDGAETGGLQVKEPSLESVAKVTNFARLTGDIAVLSQADIRVLALTYALEVELNGTRRLREAPGRLSEEETVREQKKRERLAAKPPKADSEQSAERPEKPLPVQQEPEAQSAGLDASSSDHASTPSEGEEPVAGPSKPKHETTIAETESDQVPTNDDDDSDPDSGEWITPKNVTLHKSRDLGLFPSLPSNAPENLATSKSGKKSKSKTVLKVACLTGDFAMQNVALQMGLNVFGVGGKKVKEVRTWILRCHACFKLCKDPTKKFCPSCGNPTLLRTSISYVEPTPDNPQGYILHLKSNYQYHTRGTQYSIPNPKPGSSNALKNVSDGPLILREDQKEWQRGVKRAEIAKSKQEKAAAKAMREGRGNAVFGGLSLDDPDWMPGMMLGDGNKSGGPASARTGKDGLPIIGFGRRNPNANGRR